MVLTPKSMWEGPVDGDLISPLDPSGVTDNLTLGMVYYCIFQQEYVK